MILSKGKNSKITTEVEASVRWDFSVSLFPFTTGLNNLVKMVFLNVKKLTWCRSQEVSKVFQDALSKRRVERSKESRALKRPAESGL